MASRGKLHHALLWCQRRYTVIDPLHSYLRRSGGENGPEQISWKIGQIQLSGTQQKKRSKICQVHSVGSAVGITQNRVKQMQVQKDPRAVAMLMDLQKAFENIQLIVV